VVSSGCTATRWVTVGIRRRCNARIYAMSLGSNAMDACCCASLDGGAEKPSSGCGGRSYR
jgi:hypothetical protein